MGDHREQIVDISTQDADADGRVADVREWLAAAGWAVPSAGKDWLYPTESALCASPGLLQRWPGFGGMTVVVPRGLHWVAGDGTDAAVCPVCATVGDTWDLLEQWSDERVEPIAQCDNCGLEALLGDWNLEGSVVVGSLAIVLDPQSLPGRGGDFDPADVARTLRTGLIAGVGGRWAYVHHHL
jgi:Zn ribbon nucleic-acid-binding protein